MVRQVNWRRVALLVEEGHGGDVVDAFVAGSSLGGVDGAEDAHLQIDRRLLHGVLLVGGADIRASARD